jgi:hypothetical protein
VAGRRKRGLAEEGKGMLGEAWGSTVTHSSEEASSPHRLTCCKRSRGVCRRSGAREGLPKRERGEDMDERKMAHHGILSLSIDAQSDGWFFYLMMWSPSPRCLLHYFIDIKINKFLAECCFYI